MKNWADGVREEHSCHLKRFKWQHLTLVMRLICAKSSHTGWVDDTMKEGKWVTASCLRVNIGATWLSSAASIMHHNLHQLFGSSWPAPSGWCNLTWHPAIEHHHGDRDLNTFFWELPSHPPPALSPPDFLPCFLSNGRRLLTLQAMIRKVLFCSFAPLAELHQLSPPAPPPPCGALYISVIVGRAQLFIIKLAVMPHRHACVHGDNIQRVSLGKVLRPEERMFLRAEEKQWLTSFLIVNVSWLALKG